MNPVRKKMRVPIHNASIVQGILAKVCSYFLCKLGTPVFNYFDCVCKVVRIHVHTTTILPIVTPRLRLRALCRQWEQHHYFVVKK